jgi:HD-like signal output (HDOD) protein
MSEKMNKLFEQVHKVPQVPEVVRILISQFNDPDVEMKDIAANIVKEQMIALKVLRLVNSAYFGLPKKIATIEDAIVMLGMSRLRPLVIASGIVSTVPEIKNFDIKQFWVESFTTANYAKWLANEAQCDADIAFTAGLISGLGTILIQLGQPKVSAVIEAQIKEGHDRATIEKMNLGFTSQEVSAELCRRWKFSNDLVIPIKQSGIPLDFEPPSKIACALFIARYLGRCQQQNMTEDDILQSMPKETMVVLGLSEDFFQQKLTEILALDSGLDGLLD